MIILRTHIALGAPNEQDTAEAHGAPLGEDEIRLTKRAYGWPEDAHFLVPGRGRASTATAAPRARRCPPPGRTRSTPTAPRTPSSRPSSSARRPAACPTTWPTHLPDVRPGRRRMATRAAGGKVLQALAAAVPELVGGSADLAPSTSTLMKAYGSVTADDYSGRNFHFGIREHGMGSILNGIAAARRPARLRRARSSIFSDYMRPAVRLAALMGVPVDYVWTHDSVWLGEDGPTHQPVEHLMALRAIPNLVCVRPCDANETARGVARRASSAPTGRPACAVAPGPADARPRRPPTAAPRAAPTCWPRPTGTLDAIVIGDGLRGARRARGARDAAGRGHRRARRVDAVVGPVRAAGRSPTATQVLPPAVTARVSIEAGVTFGWERWVGDRGQCDRHRPLRRLGARQGGGAQPRHLPRGRGRGRARRCDGA